MTETIAESDLATVLVRLAHLVDHVFAEVGRARGLTPQQAQLLCLLTEGPVGMTELTRLLRVEKSSLTGLVDRVERRGLLVRTRDDGDRRACRIALTRQGKRLAVDTHDEVSARLGKLADSIRASDRDRLTAGIVGILEAHSGQGRPVADSSGAPR